MSNEKHVRGPTMAQLQESEHGATRDYNHGSPHLAHPRLRAHIEEQLRALVEHHVSATGRCRVVEVGGGHGTFTDCLVEAGATVAVTEMSEPSAAHLKVRFAEVPAVTVTYDPDGTRALVEASRGCDLVCFHQRAASHPRLRR